MEPQNNFPPNLNQQNVPPISPVSEPIPQLAPQKSPARFLWPFLFILAIVVLGGIVLAAFTKKSVINPIVPTLQEVQRFNESVTATSTTSNIPANWKTYSNDKYGYILQYPIDWIVESEKSVIDEVNKIPSIVYFSDRTREHTFFVEVNQKEWLLKNEAPKIDNIIVDGVEQTVYIFPNGYECFGAAPGQDCSMFKVPIKHGGFWYNLGASRDAKTIGGVYGKIIGTFKFTRSNSPIIENSSTKSSITVLSPNGGETISPGQFTVRWSASNLAGNVTIYLTSVAGVCQLGTYPVNKGFNTFDISSSNPCLSTSKTITSGQYKVRLIADTQSSVSDLGVFDDSNSYFTITPTTGY